MSSFTNIIIFISKFLGILVIVVIGIIFLNFLFNITAYNPAVIIPVYGWAKQNNLSGVYDWFMAGAGLGKLNDPYPPISISRLDNNTYREPRAQIIGTVTEIVNARDGDTHVNIKDLAGRVLVTEFIPEYKLQIPRLNQTIRLWGITRFDLDHRWWEIHPVIGWEEIKL